MQARQPGGVFGALTLGIVKVGRDGDHYAVQLARQRFSGTRGQRLENIGRDAHRVQQARSGGDHRQAVFARLQLIRQMRVACLDVGQRAAHHALNRANGISRIVDRIAARLKAHPVALRLIVHHGRQQVTPVAVRQRLCLAATHGSHQRVCCTQINARRQTTLVRRGTHARLTNL